MLLLSRHGEKNVLEIVFQFEICGFETKKTHQKRERKKSKLLEFSGLNEPFFGDEGGVSTVFGLTVCGWLAMVTLFDLLSNFLRSLADCL